MSEAGDTLTIYRTVLCTFADADTFVVAVVEDAEKGRALLVFRDEAEAEKYRAATGNNPASEGWRPVGLEHTDLANIVTMHECSHIAVPDEWTGAGAVDFFDADAFIRLLEEAAPA